MAKYPRVNTSPCKRCGGTERYAMSYTCVNCCRARQKDPEYIAKQRRWRAENLEKARESRRRWASNNRDKENASRKRRMDGLTTEQILLRAAKFRARDRGLEFNLTLDDIVVPEVCPILGLPIVRNGENRDWWPSIDRIRTDQGYVKGNVAVISCRANRIKNDGTASEHRMVADWLDQVAPDRVFD